jgi:hypothetical protein
MSSILRTGSHAEPVEKREKIDRTIPEFLDKTEKKYGNDRK